MEKSPLATGAAGGTNSSFNGIGASGKDLFHWQNKGSKALQQ
jgi:hypothetical protein